MERRALQYSIQYSIAKSIQRGSITPAEATQQLIEALQYTTSLMKEASTTSNPRLRLVEELSTQDQTENLIPNNDILIPQELLDNPAYLLLSPREMEVFWLRLLAKPNREIATKLFVTTSTVQTHITHICEKLKINIRDFTRHAYDNGINPTLLSQED